MGHQSYHYLKLKGSTYYYSRRVPKCLLSENGNAKVSHGSGVIISLRAT